MQRCDRLASLIDRFRLSVMPTGPDDANLAVIAADDGTPCRVRFRPRGTGFAQSDGTPLLCARVDWSGTHNPLLDALPEMVEFDLVGRPDAVGLVELMQVEMSDRRCGAESVLGRLGEVLLVHILRAQIETGSTRPGLLAGLADPRLSRSIVAMHDRPGRAWRNEDLAHCAGMSLSRFAEAFLAAVGEPPAAYLRRWRMTIARQDIEAGHRVDAVARRYGFASPEGFTRAYKRHHGTTPIAQRHAGTRRSRTALRAADPPARSGRRQGDPSVP